MKTLEVSKRKWTKKKLPGRYLNIAEAANHLGMARTPFRFLVSRGHFTIFKPFNEITPGSRIMRFDKLELDEWMDQQKIKKPKEPI